MSRNMYEVVKEAADKKGLGITRVEKMAGLQRSAILKWKESSPTLASLDKVAKALGIKTSTLVERANKK